MSFTQDVKEEMLKNTPQTTYQTKYELEAFFQHTITFTGDDTIYYKSESKYSTLRFLDNLQSIYGVSLHSLFDFETDEKCIYEFEIQNSDIFNDALLANEVDFLEKDVSPDHKKIYIKTTFLILGYILNPEKNYHIEFSFNNRVHAINFIEILKEFSIFPKFFEKKNFTTLYIKDSDQISRFLTVIGAYNAMLSMENIKIYKDMRNTINRNINCETANLKKTINASLKQISAIEEIDKKVGIGSLPEPLYLVAEARLNNRDLTLEELAQMLNISKSCVNHRLRKIIELSENIN